MQFTHPLVTGCLERRYKRFLIDATLEDGTFITASVSNTGSMLGLTTPGSRIWMSVSNDPRRKYPHALQMIEAGKTLVGVNTALPNKIAEEALIKGLIPELANFDTLKREQKYGKNSRIDLLLHKQNQPDIYVEVKNVHFTRTARLAEFPDTVTARGAKHLFELVDMVKAGHRSAMLFVIQREDCDAFRISGDLDPNYAQAFQFARKNGVEAYAIRCHISPQEITAASTVVIDETI